MCHAAQHLIAFIAFFCLFCLITVVACFRMLTRNCPPVPRRWTRLCRSLGSCSPEVSSCLWLLSVKDWMDWNAAAPSVLGVLVTVSLQTKFPSVPLCSLSPIKSSSSAETSCQWCVFIVSSSVLPSMTQRCHSVDPRRPMATQKFPACFSLLLLLWHPITAPSSLVRCYFSPGSLCRSLPVTK